MTWLRLVSSLFLALFIISPLQPVNSSPEMLCHTFGFRPNPSDEEILEEFQANAENAAEVQKRVLHDILEHNANTEYLQRHGLGGRTDVESFRSRVPVILYADTAADVERIANGDKSSILCADPVENFGLSSGTSAGKSKKIPLTAESRIKSKHFGRISPVLRQRAFCLPEKSAVLAFVFAAKRLETRGGLMEGTVTSNYFHSNDFKLRDHALEDITSPDEIILQGTDFKQVMYCHLLCGLLRREDVGVVMSFFAYMVIEALRMLESCWEELCEDFRSGALSRSRVTDPILRNTMSKLLQTPNSELADVVERECRKDSPWEGIISRLWPNVKFVLCVMTGAMAPYTSSLRHYAGRIPLVNSDYGASESFPIGINMNPAEPPEKVVFTAVPNIAYLEFCHLSSEDGQQQQQIHVVDLSNVKVGETYEVVVTTFSGLYRYRLGDVVKVQGFYKSLPQFSFVRRMNVLLSINTDKTDERELQLVVDKAAEVLKEGSLEIADFTSYADLVSKPGHYVIFIELRRNIHMDSNLLQMCSSMMDSSLNNPYMRGRAAQTIGPLELCIVSEGSFSRIVESAISHGASASQFKTPRCITNQNMLNILRANTIAKYFSPAYPKYYESMESTTSVL